MTNTTLSGSPVTLTWDGKIIAKGTINSKKEKPMYRVKTSLLSEYQQGETITDRQQLELLQSGCPQDWFEKIKDDKPWVQPGQYWERDGEVIRIESCGLYSAIIQFVNSEKEDQYVGIGYVPDNYTLLPDYTQVQEGEYWEDSSGTILRVMGRLGSNYVEVLDIHTDIKKDIEKSLLIEVGRKLSDDEIEQVLTEEKDRRGYTKDNFKCLIVHTSNSGEDISYDRDNGEDHLFIGANCCYEKGEWAEIVDQTPNIEINRHKVEFKQNGMGPDSRYVKVGCKDIPPHKFKGWARDAGEFGLKIHRKGEDITDQIKKIAEYYE